ncbi:MAG: hypothetical protein SF070_03165 [Gemmatimonadota bacterium]|nr:hypothetical protein [Gemmatimonadota bacterium]
MIKKYVGLDFLDLAIHAGVTVAVMVMLAAMMSPMEEVGAASGAAASLVVLAWRRQRALRNAPALTTGEAQAERVAILEDELEAQQGRVLELEERLDFAERLLARQREPVRIPGSADAP